MKIEIARVPANFSTGYCATNHVEPLPYAAPFPEHEGYFSHDGILQRYDRLEQTLVVDLAWLQVDVRARKYSLHRTILRRESTVPA